MLGCSTFGSAHVAPPRFTVRLLVLLRPRPYLDHIAGTDWRERRHVRRAGAVPDCDELVGIASRIRHPLLLDLATRDLHVLARRRLPHRVQHARAVDVWS